MADELPAVLQKQVQPGVASAKIIDRRLVTLALVFVGAS